MKYASFFVLLFMFVLIQVQGNENMNDQSLRFHKSSQISKHLESLSDLEMTALLKEQISSETHWGTTLKLEINGIPVFVKQVPLNQMEGNLNNNYSTENFFKLPLFYQYGVGSGGFNVWREVGAHQITTEWVLNKENFNFPITYHWRILDNVQAKKTFDEEEFKNYVTYWNNSDVIGERIKANYDAMRNVVIFAEYIPENLKSWLNKEFQKGPCAVDQAVAMADENLQATVDFLNKKELLHFDAHFENIMTDGKHLYFSDFGLAISPEFNLTNEEVEFFYTHSNYDRYYVATKLTNWIVGKTFGKQRVNEILTAFVEERIPSELPETLTPYLSSIIHRYAAVALTMNRFFETLISKSKEEPFPAIELEVLWNKIESRKLFLTPKP